MAKQDELREMLDALVVAADLHGHLRAVATAEGRTFCEKVGEQYSAYQRAEKRIFSFFNQMRRTFDGLKADVDRMCEVRKALTTERDEAVRQVRELFPKWREACAERDQLRKGDVHAKDMFVPFDPARGSEGLEMMVSTMDGYHWIPADYIGKSSKGFHVVDVEGQGIICVNDADVGCLRHRVKQKTVTLHVNVYKRDDQYSAGYIGVDRNEALNQMTNADYAGTFPVKITVAE